MRVELRKVLFRVLPVAVCLLIVPVASAGDDHRFQERYISHYSPGYHQNGSDRGHQSHSVQRAHRSDRGHPSDRVRHSGRGDRSDRADRRFHRDLRRPHHDSHHGLQRTQRRHYDSGYGRDYGHGYGYQSRKRDFYSWGYDSGASCGYRPYRSYGRWYR